MKKKICIITFILVSICLGCFTFIQKNNDKLKWQKLYTDNTISITFVDTLRIEDEKLIEICKNIAVKYNANLYKILNTSEKGSTRVIASFITNDYYKPYQVVGNDLTTKTMNGEYFISTESSDSTRQIGIIKDVFADDQVIIGTFDYYLKNYELNNNITIEFKDLNLANHFFDELAQSLNITRNEMTINPIHINENSPLNILAFSLVAVSLLTFCIIVFYYTCYNSKKIGVLKLNGFDKNYIFEKIMMPIYLTALLTASFGLGIMAFFVKNADIQFWLNILKYIFSMFFLIISLSFISYFILSKFTLIEILKGNYGKRLIEKFNYVLKIIILICCFMFSGVIISNLSRAYEFRKVISSWVNYKDYAIPIEIKTTNFTALFDASEKELRGIHKDLFSKGSLYIYNSILETQNFFFNDQSILEVEKNDFLEVEEFNRDIKFYYSTINTNYIKTLNLKDMNGEDIIFDDRNSDLIFLLPYSKVELQNYPYILKFHMADAIISDGKTFDDFNFKFIIYDDRVNNKFFSFNINLNEDGKYNIFSPVFNVITSQNILNRYLTNIFATGTNSRLKIPLNNDTIEMANMNIESIFKSNLTEHSTTLNLGGLSQPFVSQIDMIDYTLQFYTPILVLLLIVYIIIVIQSTKLYIKNNLKTIAIKKLNGFTLVHSLKKYIIKTLLLDMVASIAFLVATYNFLTPSITDQFHLIKGSSYVYLAFIPLIIVDVLFLVGNIKLIEKKSLNNLLKGDHYGNN